MLTYEFPWPTRFNPNTRFFLVVMGLSNGKVAILNGVPCYLNTVEWLSCNSELLTKKISWYFYVIAVKNSINHDSTRQGTDQTWWSSYSLSMLIYSCNHGCCWNRQTFVSPSFVQQGKDNKQKENHHNYEPSFNNKHTCFGLDHDRYHVFRKHMGKQHGI